MRYSVFLLKINAGLKRRSTCTRLEQIVRCFLRGCPSKSPSVRPVTVVLLSANSFGPAATASYRLSMASTAWSRKPSQTYALLRICICCDTQALAEPAQNRRRLSSHCVHFHSTGIAVPPKEIDYLRLKGNQAARAV
jgi:hypothetical protein